MFSGGAGDLWLLSTVVGVIVLGLVIAYGMRRTSKVTPAEHEASERGAARVRREENAATKAGG